MAEKSRKKISETPERIDAEFVKQLSQAKREWEVTVDSLEEIIILINKAGQIVRANRSIESWKLGKVTQVKGILFHDFFHPTCDAESCPLKEYWLQAQQQLLANQCFEWAFIDPILKRHLHLFFRPVLDDRFHPNSQSESFAVGVIQDITEKIRLESISQTVNLMDHFGYIFSGIRHEIGNPLNAIKMTMSILKNNFDHYSGDMVAEYIERVLFEIGRVEYLLKSLKNFNMFENLRPENVEIKTFMKNFLALVASDLEKEGISLSHQLNPVNPRMGYFDPRAFHQVLLNIIGNAVDALKEIHYPKIAIQVKKAGSFIRIAVSDNGVGISAEQHSNLFKPFFTTKPKGTGLGLVIVKKLLYRMNGAIEVESQPGKGTKITMMLPEGKIGQ